MNKQLKNISIVIVLCLTLIFSSQTLKAQDTGKPAIRTLAYYTLGGGAGGAVLGVAFWMLDPLAPGANLRGSMLQGYGAGVMLGLAFGVMQLNRQAVLPYQAPEIPSEFEGGAQNFPTEGNSFHYAKKPEKLEAPQIPIFNYQIRF